MEPITRDELRSLMEQRPEPAVSIYMPVLPPGAGGRQSSIRLKKALADVERVFDERGFRRRDEVFTMLEPAHDLVKNAEFWRGLVGGLAIFIGPPEVFRTVQLPREVDDFVFVGEHFYTKPLLRLLVDGSPFFVLAASRNKVRLLSCTRNTVEEVDHPDLPRSIDDELPMDDPERQLQFHTRTAPSGGAGPAKHGGGLARAGRPAVFHGQEDQGSDPADRVRRYMQRLHDVVRKVVGDNDTPLVVAADEPLISMYAEVSSHRSLIDKGLPGNPDELREETLRDRCWELVEPHFLAPVREAADRFMHLTGTGRTSDRIEQVAAAAAQGRVDTLFVAEDARRWGRFDPELQEAVIGEDSSGGAGGGEDDLIDFMARQTYLNSGEVYIVGRDEVPAGGEVAAIFRY